MKLTFVKKGIRTLFQINPQHTVPFLDDNGFKLADSHAICAYLSDKYGESDSLYPKDLEKRALVNSRMYFDCGHLFARMRFLYEPVLFMKSSEWPEDRVQGVHTAWDILECFLENGPYVCGDEMTVADFCLVATASSMTETIPLEPEKYQKVLEWIDRMSELSYYEELNGASVKEFQAGVISLREKNAEEE